MTQPLKQQASTLSKVLTIPLFRQTRTRILILYVLLMMLCMGAAVPLFRVLTERQISERVQEDLEESKANFEADYQRWEQAPSQTVDDLRIFVDQFLGSYRPEDDNFLMLLIDGELYRASPSFLPQAIQPDSQLFQQLQQLTRFRRGEWPTSDPKIGTLLYKAMPLSLDGEQRGVLVVAHATAGERSEALDSVNAFVQVTVGVLLCAVFLAWLGTGRLLKPVRDLATTARNISESDLTQRLLVHGSGELADLSETFNAMMDRLQGAFASQRRFVNDAGHELRTPITIVRGHLELMGHDPQEQQETIDLVLDELDRMGRLVNDMIALAKAERPDFLQYEIIELQPFLEDVFAKAQTLAERQWRLASRCNGTLMGDRQRLTGALLNLLRNAAQHTEATNTIELGCRTTPTRVQFWVKDTGMGIALADQPRVFERFARISDRKSEGSGLGLAIVKAFTEAHRGTITLASQPGQGATFTITLPYRLELSG